MSRKQINGLSFLLLLAISARSESKRSHGTECEGNHGLKYEVGQSYFYRYHSESGDDGKNHATGNSVLAIKGTVVLTPLSKCEFVITLQDGVITTHHHTNGASIGKISIGKTYSKFIMNNGLVDKVIVDSREDAWTQNIIKGILTMIQNRKLSDKEQSHETNEASVYGYCRTTYSAGAKMKKTINITMCGKGEGSDLVSQGVKYRLPNVQNKQIFGFLRSATHCECSQTLEKEIYSTATCKEVGSGPFFTIGMKSSLTYTSTATSMTDVAELKYLTRNSSIVYNYTFSVTKEMQVKAEEQIKFLLSHLKSDKGNKASIFIDLKKMIKRVHNLQQFDKRDILTDEIQQKTFYDALAEVATDDSVVLLAKLCENGNLDSITQLKFFTTIAFAPNPGPTAMRALTPLIKNIVHITSSQVNESIRVTEEQKRNVSLSQHLLLGASGLAHQFCRVSKDECIASTEYVEMVNAISAYAKVDSMDEILIASLHALGNLDSLTSTAVEAIDAILMSTTEKVLNWTVITAFEAMRRDSCQATLKKTVRNIFADTKRNDQVRIHAYLSLSKCLDNLDIQAIHDTMKDTKSSVGVFIASHVGSIRGSWSPSKLQLNTSMDNIQVSVNLKTLDKSLQSSYFVEYSAFNSNENYGVSGEATIIYTSEKMKPEFFSINATIDLYGRSFNLLEIGLSRRHMMPNQMQQGEMPSSLWFGNDVLGAKDTYYRIFGTTIGLGLESLKDTVQTSIMQIMSGENHSWNFNAIEPMTLADEELTFPSLMGLPYTYDLHAVEFDTVKLLLLSGKTPINEIFESFFKPPFNYKLNIETDYEVEAKGGISLGGNTPIAIGTRFNANMNNRVEFGVEVGSNATVLADFRINFPSNVIESTGINANLFHYHEAQGVSIRLKKKGQAVETKKKFNPTCVKCQLTGLQKCSLVVSEQHLWESKCTLEKIDPKMEGYELQIINTATGYEMVATTPGSDFRREFKLNYIIGNAEKSENIDIGYEVKFGKLVEQGRVVVGMKTPTTSPSFLPSDYSVTLDRKTNSNFAKSLKFEIKQPKENDIELKIDVSRLGSFATNCTFEARHIHVDFDMSFLPDQLQVNGMCDVRDDEKEIIDKCKLAITHKRPDYKINMETSSILNVPKRTLEFDASSSSEKRSIFTFNLSSKFADDIMNGRNTVSMRLDNGEGIYTGSINQTNKMTPEIATSVLEAEFVPSKSPAFTYTSSMTCDGKLKEPSLYDTQALLSVQSKFKGVILAPIEIDVTKEVDYRKVKGKFDYGWTGSSNISMNKKPILWSGTTVNLRTEEGILTAIGYSKDARFQHDFMSHVLFRQKDVGTQIQNTTFSLKKTDIIEKKVQNIAEGSVNKSLVCRSLLDFEIFEFGHMEILDRNVVDWEQLILLHSNEFKLFQEMKEFIGKKTHYTKFMLDISAKVIEEKQKLKFEILTKQQLSPTCPASNFNFTL